MSDVDDDFMCEDEEDYGLVCKKIREKLVVTMFDDNFILLFSQH